MGGLRLRVSDEDMRKMRDAGMTNADIANSLGISYRTVWMHIGPQPGKNWADYQRRMRQSPIVQEPELLTAPGADAASGSAPEATLAVTNRMTYLTGEAAEYCVDASAQTVCFMPAGAGEMVEISFEQWPRFVREAQAIAAHLAEARVGVEMW